MKNILTQNILKILAVLGVVAVVVVLAVAYANMFKNLKAKPGQKPLTTASQSGQAAPSEQISPTVPVPVEAKIGTVADVSLQPDGKVQLTVDKKTYLLPSDQKVKLYTSKTETTSVPASQLKKEMIVNIMKFTNPEKYEVVGVTSKTLIDKLL